MTYELENIPTEELADLLQQSAHGGHLKQIAAKRLRELEEDRGRLLLAIRDSILLLEKIIYKTPTKP